MIQNHIFSCSPTLIHLIFSFSEFLLILPHSFKLFYLNMNRKHLDIKIFKSITRCMSAMLLLNKKAVNKYLFLSTRKTFFYLFHLIKYYKLIQLYTFVCILLLRLLFLMPFYMLLMMMNKKKEGNKEAKPIHVYVIKFSIFPIKQEAKAHDNKMECGENSLG